MQEEVEGLARWDPIKPQTINTGNLMMLCQRAYRRKEKYLEMDIQGGIKTFVAFD